MNRSAIIQSLAILIAIGVVANMSAFAQKTDFFKIGTEALNQRKYEIAIEYFDKALLFQPNAPQALYNRGLAYSRLGKDSLALLDYTAYLEVLPNNPTTYIARGVVYHKMGRQEQAVADLTRAVELDSTSGIAWAVLGDSYMRLRLDDKAIAAWKNSVERDPKGPYAAHVREQLELMDQSLRRKK